MEFKVFQKEIALQSKGWRPTFHDVTSDILKIVEESGIKNGTVCIASHHTTCSVMIQECSHDIDIYDLEYLQHDLLKIMQKIIPDYSENNAYMHPGPIHSQFGRYVNEPGDHTSLNTDGHLRSCNNRLDYFQPIAEPQKGCVFSTKQSRFIRKKTLFYPQCSVTAAREIVALLEKVRLLPCGPTLNRG